MVIDQADRAASGNEREDLAFRHRTLLAAQHILEEQYESAVRRSKKDHLNLERLRRLRAYVGNAVTALERRMEDLEKHSIGVGCRPQAPPPMRRGAAEDERAETAAE